MLNHSLFQFPSPPPTISTPATNQPTDGLSALTAVAEKKVCDAKNHPEMMNSNKFYLHNHLCKYFKILVKRVKL